MTDLVTELQDLRHLDWALRKMSPGTPGCFLKAYEESDERKIYYKLSNYDSYRGVYGHESVNELIVSRLLDVLDIPHVKYHLVHACLSIDGQDIKTWVSASFNFRQQDEEKIAFDIFYDMEKESKESPYEFAARYGWETYICQMICVDYLIANRDRHGGNIEVLRNLLTEQIHLAPLFDQGLSLLFSTYGDEKQIFEFDVMKDIQANNFIGSISLEYNLSLIPSEYNLQIRSLKERDCCYIMNGLENVLGNLHREKIWEMLWKRWCYFETICSQKRLYCSK